MIGASPDGRNINLNCGSTHPQLLADAAIRGPGDILGDGTSPLSNEPIQQLFQLTRNASRKAALKAATKPKRKAAASA